MNEIPLCEAFHLDKLVGHIKLTSEYENQLTQALMDDIKFLLGATILNNETNPKLGLLTFVPRESIDYKELLKKYIYYVGACEGTTYLLNPHREAYYDDEFTDEEWNELQKLDEEVFPGSN